MLLFQFPASARAPSRAPPFIYLPVKEGPLSSWCAGRTEAPFKETRKSSRRTEMKFSFSSRRDPRTHDAIGREPPVRQGGVVKEQRSNQIWHLCLLDVLIAARTSADSTTRRRRKQRDPQLERGSFFMSVTR